jgi:hypothetical protein
VLPLVPVEAGIDITVVVVLEAIVEEVELTLLKIRLPLLVVVVVVPEFGEVFRFVSVIVVVCAAAQPTAEKKRIAAFTPRFVTGAGSPGAVVFAWLSMSAPFIVRVKLT